MSVLKIGPRAQSSSFSNVSGEKTVVEAVEWLDLLDEKAEEEHGGAEHSGGQHERGERHGSGRRAGTGARARARVAGGRSERASCSTGRGEAVSTRGAGLVGERTRAVGVGLDVGIRCRLLEALNDGHEALLGAHLLSGGQNNVDGNVDSLLVKVVSEHNITGRERRGVLDDLLKVVHDLGGRDDTGSDAPVVGVVRLASGRGGPDDRGEAHLKRDGTDTVINVTVRRTHGVGSNANDGADDLLAPAKFGNDLLVGEGGEGVVGPGVNRNLVTLLEFGLEHLRARDDTRTDHEEGGLEVVLVEVFEQGRSVGRGAVIVRETPGVGVGTGGDVSGTGALTARPPAVAVSTSLGKVGRVATARSRVDGGGDVGHLGPVDLRDPLLDLRRVGRWHYIKRREVGRKNRVEVGQTRGTSDLRVLGAGRVGGEERGGGSGDAGTGGDASKDGRNRSRERSGEGGGGATSGSSGSGRGSRNRAGSLTLLKVGLGRSNSGERKWQSSQRELDHDDDEASKRDPMRVVAG